MTKTPFTALQKLTAHHFRRLANLTWRLEQYIRTRIDPRELTRVARLAELAEQLSPATTTLQLSNAITGSRLSLTEVEGLIARAGEGDLIGALAELRRSELSHVGSSPSWLAAYARAETALRLIEEGVRLPDQTHTPRNLASARVGLFFHSRGPLVPNGYAARSEEVIRAIGINGWQAEAVTRLGYPRDINRFAAVSIPATETYNGIPCHLLPDPQGGLQQRSLDNYAETYGAAAAEAFASFAPSVLHAASNWQNGLAALHASARSGAAVVYEARGLWEVTALSRGDYDEFDARFRLAAKMETVVARGADCVLALSEGLADALTSRGVPREKIVVAPNCAPLPPPPSERARAEARALAGVPPDVCVIGYLGLIGGYEGIDTLVEGIARARIISATPLHLLLVGDGPARASIERRIEALGLGQAVTQHGRVDRESATVMAQAVDIAPLPRKDLPVTRIVPPIKAVEAAARGNALIVSDLPALTSIVQHDISGIVVPPSDEGALAKAIVRLADEPDLRRRLGEGARRTAEERFAIGIVGKRIVEAYDRALEVAHER